MKSATTLLLCWTLWAASAVSAAETPPVHTNKTRFRIPYRYDAVEMQKLGAMEIRLFASYDQGLSWAHIQSVAPATGRFEFQAAADGEYWFAVRTLDVQNRLHPQTNAIEAGLKVVVDTTAPSLNLSITQSAPGRVQLSWSANDLNIDPAQLRLEYIQAGMDAWQPVGVIPRPSGQTSWSLPQGGRVAVRGAIADLAGNVGQAQSQSDITPVGQQVPRQPVPDFREPIAGAGQYPQTQQPAMPHFTPQTTMNSPNGGPQPSPQFGGTAPSPSPWNGNSSFISSTTQNTPDILKGRYADIAAPAQQPVPQTYGKSARNRVVNSHKFQIGYQIEEVGASGVGSVEFYITQDDGTKWYRYGDDPDKQSPFQVDVPRDGTYGFALRVRSGAGLAADPPQPGEKPSIIVTVDSTPPAVQLLPAQQGRGAASNRIILQWRVSDELLHEEPIGIAYSGNREGPWQAIAGWLPNTGSYEWTVGPGMPQSLYFRLTCRDAAGNMTTAETTQPVVIDLSRPSARIVDVESEKGMNGRPY